MTAPACPRSLSPALPDVRTARLAFLALCAFVLVVFACPGTVFPELAPYLPAKGIALLALGALGCSWLLRGRGLWLGGATGVGLLVVLGIALFTPLWSTWPAESRDAATELAKFVVVFALVVNVVDTPARLRAFTWMLVLGTTIPCIGALKNYALGENLVEGDRAAWLSTFGNPDELAYYLIVAVPFALALREQTRRHALRWGLLGVVALFVAGVFLSASRGGILTLCVVAVMWWLRDVRRGRLGFWFLAAAVVVFALVPSHVWMRTSTLANYSEDASAMGRIWTMQAGWRMFLHRPWGGMGAGTFALAFPSYGPQDATYAMAAHNSFVQVLAEDGLFALVAFVIAIAAAAAKLRWQVSQRVEPMVAALSCGLVAFVLSSLTAGIALSWPIYWTLGLCCTLPIVGARTACAPEHAR
jgi:O-antigen ligase